MAQHFPGPLRPLSTVVFERRCALYERAAILLAGAEGVGTRPQAKALIEGLRRTLRGGLAFLDRAVVRELELLEGLGAQLADGALTREEYQDLQDRLALLHLQLGRLLHGPQSLVDFRELTQLDPRLEQRLRDERRLEEVQARARALEEEGQALEAEARGHIASEDFPRAARALRRAIRIDPRRAVLRNDLGVVLSLLGKTEEAIAEYRAAIALNEQEPERRTEEWTTSYYNLGVALRKQAQAAFRSGWADEGRDHLASAGEAFAAFCDLAESDPSAEPPPRLADAQAGLAEIRRRLGAPLDEPAPNPS